ncbi:MauE/DoxX family redox-associated membrane protein [Spirillospora albida]|uniref:MauE/DoxX family redox-associated membrane protein n=1 Tax=Spirillospora albida TaxID=58123 RepID=UPI0004C05FC2|nr:MauE/DoxX family redox-associated membrane protein [Spirillospora albida]
MVTAFMNAQVLLLAAVLLAASLAKLTVREAPAPDEVHGVPVPAVRRTREATVALGLAEGALGLALLLTPHPSVRLVAAVVFAAATWVVGELRVRRPDAGCGCFGGLSGERVGHRSVVRAALLTGAAIAALGAPLAGIDVLGQARFLVGLMFTAEVALFAALSPELSELVGRHRRRRVRPWVPCERRRAPLTETLATLHASAAWAALEGAVTGAAPLDAWREGCWRFVVYPARLDGTDTEVVFAVSTAERDRTVRAVHVRAGRAAPASLPPSTSVLRIP